MSGSSTILQALLPGRSGDVVQRGTLLKKNDQSFASVFEKRIQMRQEKPSLPLAASEIRDRKQPVSERREPEQAVDRTGKTEKPASKNPAKEKMKELVKKVKDTLDAMKDPEATPEQLKKLAGDLKEALAAIKALSEAFKAEGNTGEVNAAAGEILTAVVPAQTGSQIRGESIQTEAVNTEVSAIVQTKEPHGRQQTQELKENLMLKDFKEVLSVQADLIAEDPALKEALKQILVDVKTVLSSETQHEAGLTGEVEALLGKLNGMVVKAETAETGIETLDPQDAAETPVDGIPAAAADAGASNAKDQQTPSDDSTQTEDPQSKQAYGAEIPVEQKNTEKSEPPRTAVEKSVAGIEKTETAASKPVVQSPTQAVPNPQAFQDTLDAVKDGVQAKTQFQSKIMEQVVETIKMNLKTDDGKTEMLMKLKPESLGNVALKVSIDKGIVMAELQVESQAVKQALESNLQDLRSALQDKGFNVFDLDVSVRKDNQQQNQDSGRNHQGKTAKLEASVERIEQRLMSLESSYNQSTIDYLG